MGRKKKHPLRGAISITHCFVNVKNFVCFLLNSISFIIGLRVKGIPSKKVKKWYNDFNAKLNKITLVENNEKMTEEQRKKTIAFYMDSIKNVEKLTGRSLEGIWY